MLTGDEVAALLDARGILYAPDFVANAGGLISVYGELRDLPHERALDLAAEIEGAMERILQAAADTGTTPLAAARAVALARLNSGRRVRAAA